MASGRFSKQAVPFINAKYLNSGTGDSVVGGTLTGAPSGIGAQQFQQNLPGDRIILNPADALALSNTTAGNLYTGTYRYVATRNNSTTSPVNGRVAFWDQTPTGTGANIASTAADQTYQVTSDGNAANYTDIFMAGVFISNITKGNWGWIQESGKCTIKAVSTLTGTGAIGVATYLPLTAIANSNAVDTGCIDVVSGANAAGLAAAANFYATVSNLLTNYVGIAETAPTNNNTCLIQVGLGRLYRW